MYVTVTDALCSVFCVKHSDSFCHENTMADKSWHQCEVQYNAVASTQLNKRMTKTPKKKKVIIRWSPSAQTEIKLVQGEKQWSPSRAPLFSVFYLVLLDSILAFGFLFCHLVFVWLFVWLPSFWPSLTSTTKLAFLVLSFSFKMFEKREPSVSSCICACMQHMLSSRVLHVLWNTL